MPAISPLSRMSRCWRLAAAAWLLLFGPGCAVWDDLRGPGFSKDFRGWADSLRPKEAQSQTWGFSTKAQQIERDLGVGQ
jgi:hypothetical protein